MSEPTAIHRCPTCRQEYVSDAEWDAYTAECPDCVAAADEQEERELFNYRVT